jgi:hypothetical protein
MIKVQKQQQNAPVTVIRAATGNELTNYEKKKLANIEENAERNVIEAIRINGTRATVDENKVADFKLGTLVFKDNISQSDINPNEYFFIRCELEEN